MEPVSAALTASRDGLVRRRRGRARRRGVAAGAGPLAPATTVTRMLTPSDAPSCCAALTTPEAAPASSAATPASPRPSSGASAAPMPRPSSTSGIADAGEERRRHVEPAEPAHADRERRRRRSRAGACRPSAPRAGARNGPIENITAVIGRKAMPACSGREAADALQVLAEEEEHREHPADEQHARHVRARPLAAREQAQRRDGLPARALDRRRTARAATTPATNDATSAGRPSPPRAARTKP